MTAPHPWTPTDDTRLTEMAANGDSIRKMAAEFGCSPTTVRRHMKHLGITVDRTRTQAATAAATIDARARRAKLEIDLLADAARLRKRLWQPSVVFNFGGRDNTYEEHSFPEPPVADQLKLMQAVGIATDRSLKLSLHDKDDGHGEAKSALDDIMAAIRSTAADDDRQAAQ